MAGLNVARAGWNELKRTEARAWRSKKNMKKAILNHPAARAGASLFAVAGCVAMALAGFPVFGWAVFGLMPAAWAYILFLVVNRRKMTGCVYIGGGACFILLVGGCIVLCLGGFPVFRWLVYIFFPLTWVYGAFGMILVITGEINAR